MSMVGNRDNGAIEIIEAKLVVQGSSFGERLVAHREPSAEEFVDTPCGVGDVLGVFGIARHHEHLVDGLVPRGLGKRCEDGAGPCPVPSGDVHASADN